jgi:hypothetical protein
MQHHKLSSAYNVVVIALASTYSVTFSTPTRDFTQIPLCGSKRVMACSIKGDVKKILLLRPEGGDFRDIQPLSVVEDAGLVSCPWIGFALFHLSSCIFD